MNLKRGKKNSKFTEEEREVNQLLFEGQVQ